MTKISFPKKIAVITGFEGQDGTFLHSFLKNRDEYDIITIGRKYTFFNGRKITHCDILCYEDVKLLLKNNKISEIYHLAAKVLSTESRLQDENRDHSFIENFDINVKSLHNFLINIGKKEKLFYPASSYMFHPSVEALNEESKISPSNLYSINKSSAYWLSKYFRENYNLFVSVGIMFNHESSLRSNDYITKKIIKQAKEILKKKRKRFEVHNVYQKVDWGHAQDYVRAMHAIIQLPYADDFVISSGSLNTIKDFIKIVCKKLNIVFSENLIKSKVDEKNNAFYFGDNSKIISKTSWVPTKSLEDIIEDML